MTKELSDNFMRVEADYKLFVRKDLCDGEFLSVMKDIDEDYFNWQKNSKSAKFAKFQLAQNWYYIKKLYNRSFLEKVKAVIKGSRAFREFEGNTLLQNHGIITPNVAAIIEGKRGVFLITDEFKSQGTFLDYITNPENSAAKRRVATKYLAEILAKLHNNNIILGDINMNNALVCDADNGIKICILDNERTRKRLFAENGIVKNLVQLNKSIQKEITACDRFRFYKYYAQARGIGYPDKDFLKLLIDRTIKRRQKSSSLG